MIPALQTFLKSGNFDASTVESQAQAAVRTAVEAGPMSDDPTEPSTAPVGTVPARPRKGRKRLQRLTKRDKVVLGVHGRASRS